MGDKKFKSILLIDDDDASNFLNRMLLNKANVGDHIDVALNGREALNKLQAIIDSGKMEDFPEIIFLDLNMPVLDGWEFLEGFNTFPKAVKERVLGIYLLTTSLRESDRQKARKNPYIQDFVEKPITLEYLDSIKARHCQSTSLTG